MGTTTIAQNASISVTDFRCNAGPADAPFVELHCGYCVSYVRKGSLGYRVRGETFELVAGSVLFGHPGNEFMCTHENACGDERLSIQLAPELIETLANRTGGDPSGVWRSGCVSPLPELMVLGELAQAAVEGRSAVAPDEAGLLFAKRFVDIDDEARRFAYAAVGGRATHHNASIQVFDHGAGHSRLVWITDLLPNELSGPIGALV